MRLINRLRLPGEIRSASLNPETVIVRTIDDVVVVYRRTEDENVGVQDVSVRRSSLSSEL